MKYTIRKGVFETNSSSVHAIVIHNIDKASDPSSLQGFCELGEFGWGWDILLYPLENLSYIYTFACQSYFNKDIELIKNLFPYVTFEAPKYDEGYGCLEHGYVDHGAFDEDVELTEDLILDIVFNSTIVIGNDNDDYDFDRYTEAPNVKKVIWKHN